MDKCAFIPNINQIKTETNNYLQYNKEKISKEKINEFFNYIKKIRNNKLGILLTKNDDEKQILDFLKECDYDIELAKMKINYPIFGFLNNDYYKKIDIENTEQLIKTELFENKFIKKEKENNFKKEINNILKEKEKISSSNLTNILNEIQALKIDIPNNLKIEINKSKILSTNIEKLAKEEKNEEKVNQFIKEVEEIKIEPNNVLKLFNIKEKIEKIKINLKKYIDNELDENTIDNIYNDIINYELIDNEFKNFKIKIVKCKTIFENCNNLYKKIRKSGFELTHISKVILLNNLSIKYNIKINKIEFLNENYHEYLNYINRMKMVIEDYNNYYDTKELINLQIFFDKNKNYHKYYLEILKNKIKLNNDYNYILNNFKNKKYQNLCIEKYNFNKKIFEKHSRINTLINFIENIDKIDYYINILEKDNNIYDIFNDNKKIKELVNNKLLEKKIIYINLDNEKIIFIKKKYDYFKEIYDLYLKRNKDDIILELNYLKKIINNGIINDNLIKNVLELEKKLNLNYQIYKYLKFYKKIDNFFDEDNNEDNEYYKNIKVDNFNNIFKNKDKICKEYKDLFDKTIDFEKNEIINLSYKLDDINNYKNYEKEFYINNLQYNVKRLLKIKNYNLLFNKLIKNENYQYLLNIKKKIKIKLNDVNNNNYDLSWIIDLNNYDKLNLEKILNYEEILEFKDNFYNIKEFKNFNKNLLEFFEINKILEENFNSYLKKNKFEENEILIIFYQYLKLNAFLIHSPLIDKVDNYFKEYIDFLKISKYNNDKKTQKDMKCIIGNYFNNFKLYNRYFIKLKLKFAQYEIYLKEISKLVITYNKGNSKNKEYILDILNDYDFEKIKFDFKLEENIINIKNNKYENNNNENVKRQRKVNQNILNKISNKKTNLKKKLIVINKNEESYCICRTNFNYQNMICCDYCEEWFHYDCIRVNKIINDSKFECVVCEYLKIIFNKKKTISNLLSYLINRKIGSENLEIIYKINNIFKKEFKGEEIDYIESIKINNFNFIELSNEIINKTEEFLKNFDELKKDNINYDYIKEYYIKAKNICYSYFSMPFIINFNETLFKSYKILEIIKKDFDLELNALECNKESIKNSISNDIKMFSFN